MISKKWKWIPLISSIMFILIGIWFLIKPDDIREVLPYILGTVIIIMGIEEIIYSFGTGEYTILPGFHLTEGIISMLLGVVFIVKNDFSLMVLGLILGLWTIMSGTIKLNIALREKALGYSWLWDLFVGLIQIVFGFVLIINPFKGIETFVIVVGVYFIITGINILVTTHYFNKWLKFE